MRKRVAKVRVEMIKEKSVYCLVQELSSPLLCAEFGRTLYYKNSTEEELHCPTKEIMIVCCVDMRGKPLVVEHVSIGTSSGALVGMKELFMSAILCNAAEIVCLHNHPSGNPNPSQADVLLTKKIIDAGKILGIPLRDHIIIGDEGYYSYTENCVSPWRDEVYETAC